MRTRLVVFVALTLLVGAAGAPVESRAQGMPFNLPGTTVGSARVTGATWNFDGDLSDAGPWGAVVVTNVACGFLVQPGTAQAGLFYLTADLSETGGQGGAAVSQADFTGSRGAGNPPSGNARVIVLPGDTPATHVDVTLWDLPSFFAGSTFSVCLARTSMESLTAIVQADRAAVAAMGYQPLGSLPTDGPDGTTFVAVVGQQPSGDGQLMWVFFFNGTTYLGTDTAEPSAMLNLAGSPGPGQIDVQYADFAPGDRPCCPSLPPVTITYTWDGTSVTPSGTPPGH